MIETDAAEAGVDTLGDPVDGGALLLKSALFLLWAAVAWMRNDSRGGGPAEASLGSATGSTAFGSSLSSPGEGGGCDIASKEGQLFVCL